MEPHSRPPLGKNQSGFVGEVVFSLRFISMQMTMTVTKASGLVGEVGRVTEVVFNRDSIIIRRFVLKSLPGIRLGWANIDHYVSVYYIRAVSHCRLCSSHGGLCLITNSLNVGRTKRALK
jgi:hypothetical protein